MKFGYTILYVADVEKTVTFYESAFGLTRTFIHESGYGEMSTGETKLSFASFELARSNGVSFAEPAAKGAVPVAPPRQKPWGQTVAYVRELNGFLVEICSPM